MAFIQSLISRVAAISAKTKILQDKVAGGGIQTGLNKITFRFVGTGINIQAIQSNFEAANEATFRLQELDKLGANLDILNEATFDEVTSWEKFRGSYGR